MAVARKILVAVIRILRRAVVFADSGADCLDRLGEHRAAVRLVRHFGMLGHEIMLRR